MENNTDNYKIAELIFLELKGELSEDEKEILNNWKNKNAKNLALYEEIINEKNITSRLNAYSKVDKKEAWNRLNAKLEGKKTIKFYSRPFLKYAAVAAIALLIGTYWFFKPSSTTQDDQIVNITTIPSGTQKATLTTSNNEVIALGEGQKRRIFQLADVSVTDTNSTLTFQQKEKRQKEEYSEPSINTLETPRGGEYTVVLSDGTRVFLNAETRLTFPEVFVGESREVIVEGEAYFEVTKSQTQAFIVKTKDYDIKVYGTSFNVSAYSSDENSHTTLVEGSVGINTTMGTEVKLIPGEQAYYNKTNHSMKTRKVDTYLYTSWKDGKFMFDNESLEEIMHKLERWYNTETKYVDEEIKNRHFSGTLNRYENISDILNLIALTTHIEFKIEDNTIYVNKKKSE